MCHSWPKILSESDYSLSLIRAFHFLTLRVSQCVRSDVFKKCYLTLLESTDHARSQRFLKWRYSTAQ